MKLVIRNEIIVIERFLKFFNVFVFGLLMLKLLIDCRIIVFILLSSMVNM